MKCSFRSSLEHSGSSILLHTSNRTEHVRFPLFSLLEVLNHCIVTLRLVDKHIWGEEHVTTTMDRASEASESNGSEEWVGLDNPPCLPCVVPCGFAAWLSEP